MQGGKTIPVAVSPSTIMPKATWTARTGYNQCIGMVERDGEMEREEKEENRSRKLEEQKK